MDENEERPRDAHASRGRSFSFQRSGDRQFVCARKAIRLIRFIRPIRSKSERRRPYRVRYASASEPALSLEPESDADDQAVRHGVILRCEWNLNPRLNREPIVEEHETEPEVAESRVVGIGLLDAARGLGQIR